MSNWVRLTKTCTIQKPVRTKDGLLEFKDFGNYVCQIEYRKRAFFNPVITHRARIEKMNGAAAGDILITNDGVYDIVCVSEGDLALRKRTIT